MTITLFMLDLYEQFIIAAMLCIVLSIKGSKSKIILVYLTTVLLLLGSVRLLNSLYFYEGSLVYVVIVILSFFFFIITKNNYFQILVLIGFVFYFVFINASFCSILFSKTLNIDLLDLYQNNILYISCILLSKVTLTIPTLILYQIRNKLNFIFNSKKWFSLIIVEFLVFILLDIFFSQVISSYNPKLNYLGIMISFLLFIFILVVFLILNRETQEKAELSFLVKKIDFEQKYYKEALAQYSEIRRIRHDLKYMKNQLISIVKDNDLSRINEMIGSEFFSSLDISSPLVTGNDNLDYILNFKSLECQKRGYEITYVIDKCDLSFIKAMDLFILLGNIIDNAIEHCAIENKNIKFSITKQKGIVIIACSNPCNLKEISSSKKRLQTTKKDILNHGYGLSSIQLITEKYMGIFKYKVENGFFKIYCSFIAENN